MTDFPLKKFTEEKRDSVCRKCGKEIRWKYTYADYLKKKEEDSEFRNIPLNPDGTPHLCQQEQSFKCPKCGYDITYK